MSKKLDRWEEHSWQRGGAVKNQRKPTCCSLCLEKFNKNDIKVVVHQGCLAEAMGLNNVCMKFIFT